MMRENDAFIPYADREALPKKLKDLLTQYESRMGFMPNALKLYMHRPEILSCLIQLNNTVMRDTSSQLDDGLKRRIAAICSTLNKSAYCIAHNANTLTGNNENGGEGWDYSEEEVRRLLSPDYEPENPIEKAALAYAKAATIDPTNVPSAILASLTETMTPPQIVELACVVGFWGMYNSVHEALSVPIEEPVRDRTAFLDVEG